MSFERQLKIRIYLRIHRIHARNIFKASTLLLFDLLRKTKLRVQDKISRTATLKQIHTSLRRCRNTDSKHLDGIALLYNFLRIESFVWNRYIDHREDDDREVNATVHDSHSSMLLSDYFTQTNAEKIHKSLDESIGACQNNGRNWAAETKHDHSSVIPLFTEVDFLFALSSFSRV